MSEHHYERKFHTCAQCNRYVDGDGQPEPLCDSCSKSYLLLAVSTEHYNDDDEMKSDYDPNHGTCCRNGCEKCEQ